MKPDCWICANSIGAGMTAAVRMVTHKGYGNDHADTRGGVSIVCQLRKRINSKPTSNCGFSREPGADDE